MLRKVAAVTIILLMFLLYTSSVTFSIGDNEVTGEQGSKVKNVSWQTEKSDGVVHPSYVFNIYIADKSEVRSKLVINYTNNFDHGLSEIKLLLPANIIYQQRYIEIKGVKAQNQPAEYTSDNRVVTTKLPRKLAPGRSVVLTVDFITRVPYQSKRFGYYQGVGMLSNWYPVIAPYNQSLKEWAEFTATEFGDPYFYESATFKGYISAAKGIEVISPFLTGQTNSDQEFWFDSGSPARDFTLVYGQGFIVSEQKLGNISLKYFSRNPRGLLEPAKEALEYYQNIYGDYPYRQLILADVPIDNLMAMEFSAMFFLSTEHDDVGERTVAHEIAHQYWYGLVGSDQINEAWVDESLANYSSILFLKHKYGAKVYRQEITEIKRRNISVSAKLALSQYSSEAAYRNAVYSKPILFWNHLREQGGEEKLLQFFKRIQKKYRNKIIGAADLLGELQQEYGDKSNYGF